MKLSNTRILIVLALFALTFVFIQVSGTVRKTPITKPLASFPREINGWTFVNAGLFSDPIINMLGVDDYINYTYKSPQGQMATLYVSYFGAVGVTGSYHSPRNCLPGGGWNVIKSQNIPIEGRLQRAGQGELQKVTVQNGSEKQEVIYWYANRGRMIASEYWEKIYLVLDAIFKMRRDGSFIRIMGYVDKKNPDASTESLVKFAKDVSVVLDEFIPGKNL